MKIILIIFVVSLAFTLAWCFLNKVVNSKVLDGGNRTKMIVMKKVPILLAIALVFGLTGCFFNKTEDPDVSNASNIPETIEDGNVSKALDAYKEIDTEEFYGYFTEDISSKFNKLNGIDQDVSKEIANVEYKIQKAEFNGDSGEVTVEVTSSFVPSVLGKLQDIYLQEITFVGEELTEEKKAEMQAKVDGIFLELLKEPDAEKKTEMIKLNVSKVDGDWKIQPSDELFLALTGYYEEQ